MRRIFLAFLIVLLAAPAFAQMGLTGAGAASRRLDCRDVGTVQLWFDSSDSSGMTIATGVSSHPDKSGNARTGTQATGSAQPTLVSAVQNGRSIVRFTSSASQFFTLASNVTGSGGYTAISVVRRGGPTGTNQVHTLGNSGAEGFAGRWWSDARLYNSTPTKYASSNIAYSTTAFAMFATDATAADVASQWLDTVSIAQTTAVGIGTTVFNAFGRARTTEYGNYDHGETCVWVPNLSTADRNLMFARFRQKWGTP